VAAVLPQRASETDGTDDGTLKVQLVSIWASTAPDHVSPTSTPFPNRAARKMRCKLLPTSAANHGGNPCGRCRIGTHAPPPRNASAASEFPCDHGREHGRTQQVTWPEGIARIAAIALPFDLNSRTGGATQLQSGAQSTTPLLAVRS
jgi:hypothetical protein